MTGVLIRRGKTNTEMRMPHEKRETQGEDDQGTMEAEMDVMHL